MSHREPARILVVDDAPERRAAVVAMLAVLDFCTIGPGGRHEATLAAAQCPDLVVLWLGEEAGSRSSALALTRRLRADEVTVIALSRVGTLEHRLEAFAAGVTDVLDYPCAPAELRARVVAVLRRRADQTRGRLRVGGVVVDQRRHEAVADGRPLPITSLELRLLAELCRAAERPVSRSHLLAAVWRHRMVSGNALEARIATLRRKLRHSGGVEIETVRGFGYVLRQSTEARESSRAHARR